MEPTSTSRVLLGILDSPCPSPHLSAYENKIGGYPDCFVPCHYSSLPTCPVCGNTLCLLLQVYCPLENTEYHRTIHIFCCVRPACHGNNKSWSVLRSQYRAESCDTLSEEASTTTGLSATDWCVEADDWGSDDPFVAASSSSGNIEKQMEQLTISDPLSESAATHTDTLTATDQATPETTESSAATLTTTSSAEATLNTTNPFYPPAYLCVIEEPEVSTSKELRHAQVLLKQYQKVEPNIEPRQPSRGKSSGGEGYEKTAVKHGDKAFQKFHKQLEKYPHQLIRYQHTGQPLFISDSPHCLPPRPLLCKHCGAACVFELQLMPTLVYLVQSQLPELPESSNILGKQNMPDFGTVLVYTCSKSCWTDSSYFREETFFIQSEQL